MKLARVTETGEVPAWLGVTMENIGHIRPRTDANRRDASSVECRGSFTTGSQPTTYYRLPIVSRRTGHL